MSGKTVKLSIQTLQMLHYGTFQTLQSIDPLKKSGKTVSQDIQCTCLLIVIVVILYEFVHILLWYNAITVSASEPQIVGTVIRNY